MAGRSERFHFYWDIYNPFLPRNELKAKFYDCGRHPFKVVLQPINRNMNCWDFSLTLHFSQSPPHHIVLIICLGYPVSNLVTRKEMSYNHDWIHDRYAYHVQEQVTLPPQLETQYLQIEIEFDREETVIPSALFFSDGDLRQLSRDMKRLFANEENTNMTLWSANNQRAFRAHSYIMYWRWKNLFRLHGTNWRVIQTNISERSLKHILRYLYCGRFWKRIYAEHNFYYFAEVCQVIDRYELDHLYKVLVKDDLQQLRVTMNGAYTESHIFPLEIVENRILDNPTYSWQITAVQQQRPTRQSEIIFQIQVADEAGAWLKYSIESRSSSEDYVELNMEVVKRDEGGGPEEVFLFEARDFALEPGHPARSGPVLFLGSPEIFGDSSGRDTRYSIRCFVHVSVGIKDERLQSVGSTGIQDSIERYRVLSDHMRELNEAKRYAQFSARSTPAFPDDVEVRLLVHKEILKVRAPLWENGFSSVYDDWGRCILSGPAMRIVFDYIYTGKILSIPNRCFTEIADFAERTRFIQLRNLVIRYALSINQ